ncbi:MAG: hypothetical protein KCHDKBKB_01219 [Elusimicrobia bacterium]|nr:hypothetical protein [Elusimicrobiota bacterium]
MKQVGTNILKHVREWALASLAFAGGFFALAQPPCVYAAPSDSLTITLTVLDTTPPAVVPDLQGVPGADGQMLLHWSAPDENNNIYTDKHPPTNYIVRIATFSADSVGSTTTWWNSAQDVNGEPPPSTPGTPDFMLINGLVGGTTYYVGLISVDDMGFYSPIDTKSSTSGQQVRVLINGLPPLPPPPPSNFTGVALTTSSIQWSWSATLGANFYTLNAYPSNVLIAQTALLTYTESGFTPNSPISRTLRGVNAYGFSDPTSAITTYSLAAVPVNFSTTNVGFTSVSLAWSSGGNAAGTQYRLERSLDGVSYTVLTLLSNLAYVDTGLTEQTSYYYRVRAMNGDGILTNPTTPIVVFTPLQVDFVAPQTPGGLKGFLDPTGNAFTLTWDPVLYNTNGTTLTDLRGYHIYRRDIVTGSATRLTPVPLTTTAFADTVNRRTYYYTVRAIDLTGNESDDSLIADSSREVNIIFLSADGISHVILPESINDLLRSAHNKYGVPLTIQLHEEPLTSDGLIIRTIRLSLVRSDTNEVIGDLSFAKPQATVAVGYNVENGQITAGAPNANTQSGFKAKAITADQLAMYWFNGVTWIRIGGTLDLPAQAIKTKSSFLGRYQLRASANPSTLSLSQGNVYPRLFSPNNDGLNDRVYFVLENPNNVSVTGEIFDKAGRHVRTLPPPGSDSGIGTTLIWDGKDDKGNVVPGGAYIYKLTGEGRTFSGTVGVAR